MPADLDDLAALAERLAPATEAGRRLPGELVTALRDAGLFRLGVPAAAGGPEVAPAEALAAAERIARGDGSAGWCVAIAATSSLLGGYLDTAVAAELLGPPGAVAGGVWAPFGTAVREGGAWRVSGRWSFCSGVDHSDWFFGGCRVGDDATTVVGIPVTELTAHDTWRVAGLRGTGSHDVSADDVLVPVERSVALPAAAPVDGATLYRFPLLGYFALSIGAAALGIARGSIDDLLDLAGAKRPSGSKRTLAERPSTQSRVAEAEAALRAARAGFYDAVAQAWEAAHATEPVGLELRVGLRLAATHAARAAADVAREMYDLGGGSAIYDDSPLQRRFRDAHAATAHVQVSPATWEMSGRALLGLPGATSQI